eukprot:Hpha_TRINITY_DN17493_c0_g1::TRINITY_DN17493_c0_g1_i1::g.85820::m.85820
MLWSPLLMLCVFLAAHPGGEGQRLLHLPPRFMWGWGPGVSGYCGSCSIQTAGLYYGNWLTQDAVRGSTGGHDAAHEILLGDSTCCSGVRAAQHFQLRVLQWKYEDQPQPQSPLFIQWIREAVDLGQPVVFGVYWTAEKDKDFDHIVPLVGYDNDALFFNDLYYNNTLRAPLATFVKSRHECHNRTLPPHAGVQAWCLPHEVNYGFRVLGNVDPNGELLPLRLEMQSNFEPDYSKEDGRHSPPALLAGTVRVTGLAAGVRYALLRYTNQASIPRDGGFLDKFLSGGGGPEAYFNGTDH